MTGLVSPNVAARTPASGTKAVPEPSAGPASILKRAFCAGLCRRDHTVAIGTRCPARRQFSARATLGIHTTANSCHYRLAVAVHQRPSSVEAGAVKDRKTNRPSQVVLRCDVPGSRCRRDAGWRSATGGRPDVGEGSAGNSRADWRSDFAVFADTATTRLQPRTEPTGGRVTSGRLDGPSRQLVGKPRLGRDRVAVPSTRAS